MKKLEVGIDSGNWVDENNPEEGLHLLHECGFETLDYGFNIFFKTFDPQNLTSIFDKSVEELYSFYESLKAAAEKYNISFAQSHGFFPMYYPGQDAKNDYVIAMTEKMLAVCAYLECKAIVIHPWSGQNVRKDEEKEINFKLFRRLIPAAKKYGVTICLENLFTHYNLDCIEGTCSDAYEAYEYIDVLNQEAGEEIFGLCLDTGHINVASRNMYQYITTLGKRIKVVHIHDNDGTSDSHMIPFTQVDRCGTRLSINWEHFTQGLKETEYEGPLCFETFRGTGIMPKQVQKETLRLVSAIGRYFRECAIQGCG